MVEAYCVKCEAMREIKNTEQVLLKNKRWPVERRIRRTRLSEFS